MFCRKTCDLGFHRRAKENASQSCFTYIYSVVLVWYYENLVGKYIFYLDHKILIFCLYRNVECHVRDGLRVIDRIRSYFRGNLHFNHIDWSIMLFYMASSDNRFKVSFFPLKSLSARTFQFSIVPATFRLDWGNKTVIWNKFSHECSIWE